jgi:hypothetical protein
MLHDKDENIRVFVRVRPLNSKEIYSGDNRCITAHVLQKSIVLNNKPDCVFTFDGIADETSTQARI